MLRCLVHQPAHVGALDTDVDDNLRLAVCAQEVDLGLPSPGDVNMGGFVIQGVDHEPEAVGAVDDNHMLI